MNSSELKGCAAGLGGVVFLAGSLTVARHARHYQVAGLPMPNGKGGFMTFRDGYYLAAALLVMSAFWFIAAWRFARSSSASESNG